MLVSKVLFCFVYRFLKLSNPSPYESRVQFLWRVALLEPALPESAKFCGFCRCAILRSYTISCLICLQQWSAREMLGGHQAPTTQGCGLILEPKEILGRGGNTRKAGEGDPGTSQLHELAKAVSSGLKWKARPQRVLRSRAIKGDFSINFLYTHVAAEHTRQTNVEGSWPSLGSWSFPRFHVVEETRGLSPGLDLPPTNHEFQL